MSRVQVDIPNGHCSERFLFRTVFIPNGYFSERFLFRMVFIPNGFYSERFLFRKVFFSEIRNKNLSEQKPFGSKTVRIYNRSQK